MRKTAQTELWQLQTSLHALSEMLAQEPAHLDGRTCRIVARALGEILQEVSSMPPRATAERIESFAQEVLAGTEEMQEELAVYWYEELKPQIGRAEERALSLEHELDEFVCLSVDGQSWGAVCVKCLRWVYVRPGVVSGAVLAQCTGWYASWK